MEFKKGASKSEIEEAVKGKGDFIKIDYLLRFLKNADNLEIKKYLHLSLAGIYESKNMLNDAVKNMASAADISTTYKDKINFHLKEAELYIKLRQFEMADKAFKRAFSQGNTTERNQIQMQYLEYYKMQAKIAENTGKNRAALEIYEKLYSLPQEDNKKQELKIKLLELYEKLGRMREYTALKNKIEPPTIEFRY